MARISVVPIRLIMTGSLFFVVVVLMSTTALRAEGTNGAPSTKICNADAAAKGGISVEVDPATKKVSFSCGTDMGNVLPLPGDNNTITKCYSRANLQGETPLAEFFGEGSKANVQTASTTSGTSAEVSLTVGKLPEMTDTIYFACSTTPASGANRSPTGDPSQNSDGNRGKTKCVVTVTVPADPNANTCTVAKQSMTLMITKDSKTVSFLCDMDIATLLPQDFSHEILDESCQEKVKLADVLPSATFQETSSAHVFSVKELPKTEATYCYKCSPPVDSGDTADGKKNACTVKIRVSASSGENLSVSVTAGSVCALVFGLFVSSVFSTVPL
ncbi:SAG-related sequence SRS52A [Toxoplasma gondii FOU]|uniref:SAG-related sequence SRS52A n=2 Tax=Toxoplasma gondii TaxID=5811 RepID=A0A086LI50_TOXGO|nr:SAG-related sequence SRS52A [Toxoplasma gondii FOU]PUA86586.1 SAG-related sequence SRS52A [Toxoplasma gondii TgCATBr9]